MIDLATLYVRFGELDIEEYFTIHDAGILQSILLTKMRNGIRVVEIGSWKGCSTSVIANCIKDRGG